MQKERATPQRLVSDFNLYICLHIRLFKSFSGIDNVRVCASLRGEMAAAARRTCGVRGEPVPKESSAPSFPRPVQHGMVRDMAHARDVGSALSCGLQGG
jgi:hypothetical protein